MVSDHRLLNWFASFARETPSFLAYLSHPIQALSFPSLHLYSAVVASTACATVLDAMKLMSDQGVSSIAVLDDENGTLLSAVSVTDIAKVSHGCIFPCVLLLTFSRSSCLPKATKF